MVTNSEILWGVWCYFFLSCSSLGVHWVPLAVAEFDHMLVIISSNASSKPPLPCSSSFLVTSILRCMASFNSYLSGATLVLWLFSFPLRIHFRRSLSTHPQFYCPLLTPTSHTQSVNDLLFTSTVLGSSICSLPSLISCVAMYLSKIWDIIALSVSKSSSAYFNVWGAPGQLELTSLHVVGGILTSLNVW